jgi:hypothetical protein
VATYVIQSTDLRGRAAKIVQGLRRGDRFLVMHYKEPVGLISPKIPADILKKAGVHGGGGGGFREVK